ncbi:MerR family transcriptional regulator [Bradyrhizobium sp. USDA 3650]|jgi:DNA-binding transcriptional MerR regulator
MPLDASPLTIGTLAAQTGCNVATIRYYEEVGLLPKPSRGPGGHRVYRNSDLRRLIFIRRCRDFQFPIEQVRELVELIGNPERDCTAAKDLAEDHLVGVRKKLVELRALEKSLAEFAESCSSRCAGGPASGCVILEDLSVPTNTCC